MTWQREKPSRIFQSKPIEIERVYLGLKEDGLGCDH